MAADLHDGLGGTIGKRAREELIEFERFRRGMRRGDDLARQVILHGADQSVLARGGLQNGLQDKRGRRFAVGARDAGDAKALGRMLVEIGAEAGQRAASVRHHGPGNTLARQLFSRIGDDCDGTGLDGRVNVAVAVCAAAAHGDKHPAGFRAARVVVQTLDRAVALLQQYLGTVQYFQEVHPTISSQALAQYASAGKANGNPRTLRQMRPRRRLLLPRHAAAHYLQLISRAMCRLHGGTHGKAHE